MEIKLAAEPRAKDEKLGADFIPAVVYGKGVENQSLKLKRIDFDKAFKAAGESNLISLNFGQGIVKVIVKDTQHDVMKNIFTHVDFYQVNMKEKITTEIPLHFIGESKAVRELGGSLLKDITAVEIECLPSDLVDHIDVDISALLTFDDSIRLQDLKLAKGLALVSQTNETVVAVKEPKAEVEAVAAPAAAPAPEAKKEPEKK